MSLSSMTGFARARGSHAGVDWTWELKSVNGRNFDLRLRVPPGSAGIDPLAREALSKLVGRGSIQANLTLDRAVRTPRVIVNEDVLGTLIAAAERVRARVGGPSASVDALLGMRGVVEVVDEQDDEEARAALQAALLVGFTDAARRLVEARHGEGRALAGIIEGQIATIEALVARATALPARQPDAIRARLAQQIADLLGQAPQLDPDRLHQEAVMLATKADVREEIDRLTAHVAHARRLVGEGGAVGRKLDFLAQEFNREANTLCSKSNDRELTEIGLSLKTVIDQMREQIQNVE